MRKLALVALGAIATVGPVRASTAQVAGSATLGVAVEEMKLVLKGWSAKQRLLGQAVYNDSNERIGEIDDIIVSPNRAVSYAIIGVGGFLGIGKHQVAIPMDQLQASRGKFTLKGATKEALKALPEFKYAKE